MVSYALYSYNDGGGVGIKDSSVLILATYFIYIVLVIMPEYIQMALKNYALDSQATLA